MKTLETLHTNQSIDPKEDIIIINKKNIQELLCTWWDDIDYWDPYPILDLPDYDADLDPNIDNKRIDPNIDYSDDLDWQDTDDSNSDCAVYDDK